VSCRVWWSWCAKNEQVEQPGARRRPVLKAALGGVVAVGAVGGAARVWPGSGPGDQRGARPALTLVDQGAEGISELEVPLDGPVLARRSDGAVW
jgi:hypothetical protein